MLFWTSGERQDPSSFWASLMTVHSETVRMTKPIRPTHQLASYHGGKSVAVSSGTPRAVVWLDLETLQTVTVRKLNSESKFWTGCGRASISSQHSGDRGRLSSVSRGQSGLHCESQASQSSLVRFCLKNVEKRRRARRKIRMSSVSRLFLETWILWACHSKLTILRFTTVKLF